MIEQGAFLLGKGQVDEVVFEIQHSHCLVAVDHGKTQDVFGLAVVEVVIMKALTL